MVAATPAPSKDLDTLVDELYGTSAQESARQEWAQAVHTVAAKAKEVLPESHARIDKAEKLVLADAVELLDGNKARVASQGKEGVQYYVCNGTCDCQDYEYRAPAGWCKHRLARALYLRAARAIEETTAAMEQVPAEPVEAVETAADIPAQYVVRIKGKPFIRFAGLLQMGYAQGLQRLETTFISVTDTIALAQCTATFANGRVVTDVADATPGNVGATVRLHWPRLAATRAAARALRNALAVDMCSLEELSE